MAGKLASDRRPHDDFFQDLSANAAICPPSGFLYYCHCSFWLALMKNAILLFLSCPTLQGPFCGRLRLYPTPARMETIEMEKQGAEIGILSDEIPRFFSNSGRSTLLAFSGCKAGKPFQSPSEEKMITPVHFKENTVMARFLRNTNL